MAAIQALGAGIGWTDGDLGHGPAFQFRDPDGHVFEIYYETQRYVAPENERPALKNQPQRNHQRGAAVRRLDHYNLLAGDVDAIRDFFPKALGSRITEQIVLDNGQVAGCWFTVNNKSYDVAYTRDTAGGPGAFTTSPTPSTSANTYWRPPTYSWRMGSSSRRDRTSTPSSRRSFCTCTSRPATGWRLPTQGPG